MVQILEQDFAPKISRMISSTAIALLNIHIEKIRQQRNFDLIAKLRLCNCLLSLFANAKVLNHYQGQFQLSHEISAKASKYIILLPPICKFIALFEMSRFSGLIQYSQPSQNTYSSGRKYLQISNSLHIDIATCIVCVVKCLSL